MIPISRRMTSALVTGAVVCSLAAAQPARADVTLQAGNGWAASFSGNLNAHFIDASASTIGGFSSDANEARITSGWNPTKFDVHLGAPEFDGLTVTGNFEFATNVTGSASSGLGTGGPNEQNDVRVLEIDTSGPFGTVAVGRGWGIFNSQAILNDDGSGIGVGALCSVPGKIGGGTCGRMGTGYSWTAFDSKIEYDTPDLAGLTVRLGVFDPAAVPGVGQTPIAKSPRYEAEATYAAKLGGMGLKLWVGGLDQAIDSLGGPSTTMTGMDGGVRIDIAGFGLTGAYTHTKGFGNGNSSELGAGAVKAGGIFCSAMDCTGAKANQWYGLADYTVGNATFGGSYGQGTQDADAVAGIDAVKGQLTMAFVHYKVTPRLTVDLEFDAYEGKLAGVTDTKYQFVSLGAWFDL